ncbi:MAG: hypothetical protein JWN56_1235 [Sphingobacteriales bacterium]|nr:hypothetical protein [Sphingobacteriales bacterium]
MKKFIAYFDYLGFKDFIEKNDSEYQHRIMQNNFRDMEMALAKGKTRDGKYGLIPDIDNSSINCINFSDTIVFWTNDDSPESLQELLEVAYRFNWQCIGFTFPLRGSIVYGEIEPVTFQQLNTGGGRYNLNSIYGKGLVAAHLKAESQQWAGTVLHESLLNLLVFKGYDIESYLAPFAKKYKVPYRQGISINDDEYVLRLVEGDSLPEEAFENFSNGIERNFAEHNKSMEDPRAQEKLANTIKFLSSFR